MKCHNCGGVLPPTGDICPDCRAFRRPPPEGREPVLFVVAGILLGAIVGYLAVGWNGVAVGTFAGWPVGLIAHTLRVELS